jgi:hypothetical protein
MVAGEVVVGVAHGEIIAEGKGQARALWRGGILIKPATFGRHRERYRPR